MNLVPIAGIALAAIKEDKTLSELSVQYEVHPNQITDWKRQLQEKAATIFGGKEEKEKEPDTGYSFSYRIRNCLKINSARFRRLEMREKKMKCDFHCQDVDVKKYFQSISIKKDAIKLILISEALPGRIEDYFDGKGEPVFIKNTNTIFNSLGYNYKTYKDYLDNGIYMTTAIKCVKKDYLVSAETIKNCSVNLEKELDEFPNKKVIMLMGDFAIKAINYIWKRKYNERIIPAGSTYKIRNVIYESQGIRFFPSYTQTGDSFGLEKSKVTMITEDVQKALLKIQIGRQAGGVLPACRP